MAHRRVTVIVEWTPSSTGSLRSERFSSLVYPLDYASYPAASASAEATGGLASVVGTLGADTFEDVQLKPSRCPLLDELLDPAHRPGRRRRATPAPSTWPSGRCPPPSARWSARTRPTARSTSSTASATTTSPPPPPIWSGRTASLYSAAAVSTPGGAVFTTPAGTANGHAAVDTCSGCGFGDGDGVPWADASSTTTGVASATFAAGGASGLVGLAVADRLGLGGERPGRPRHGQQRHGHRHRHVDGPRGQGPDDQRCHRVGDGAVSVPGFTATATAPAGNTPTALTTSASTVAIKMWDGTGYRTVNVTPGDGHRRADHGHGGEGWRHGDDDRPGAEPASTTSTTGSSPRTSAVAQLPSLLVVTVEATVTGARSGSFTTSFDYGLLTARSTLAGGSVNRAAPAGAGARPGVTLVELLVSMVVMAAPHGDGRARCWCRR